ncbi:MAG: tetratricopeptide repeat protein [Bacteroidales bacterium]|nr:tetratricopeptide repeat protein [Bacteroidales bacterium]
MSKILIEAKKLIEEKKYENAIKLLSEKEIHFTNDNEKIDCNYFLGICYYHINEDEKAIESFSEVLNLDPNYSDSKYLYLYLADLILTKVDNKKYKSKELETINLAQKYYNKLSKYQYDKEDSRDIYFALGRIHYYKSEFDEALNNFKNAISLCNNDLKIKKEIVYSGESCHPFRRKVYHLTPPHILT